MLAFLLTGWGVFLFLIIVEVFCRLKKISSEFTRKLVHISVGTFAAFWPWLISWHQIVILAIVGFIVIDISRYLNIFGSIHSINRKTTGDLLSAISVGFLAIFFQSKSIFSVSLLSLSLADGLAAIVGTKYGIKNSYKVFGERKSLVGTLTFLVCSIIILAVYFSTGSISGSWLIILWLPIITTFLENIGVKGTDNILIPAAVALVLRFI